MLAQGGKLTIGAILVWIFATLGIDFFSSDAKLPEFRFPDLTQGTTDQTQTSNPPDNRTSAGDSFPRQAGPNNNPPEIRRIDFRRTNDLLAIGSFNIQVFGVKKAGNPNVMNILADIARQFDVLAIQEVRSINQELIPYFVKLINQNGSRYDYIIGSRQGRTKSKEQYVYIYDTSRVEVTNAGYIVSDPSDWMHREPLVTSFRTRVNNGYQPFTFKLMNVHTDPDDVEVELNALAQFVQYENTVRPLEDDLIVLGDLNASPDQFAAMKSLPGIAVAVPPNVATNTVGTKTYDNIVFNRFKTNEYVSGGVLDVMAMYNLTFNQALQVSDHQPVWALFRVNEMAPVGLAQQAGSLR